MSEMQNGPIWKTSGKSRNVVVDIETSLPILPAKPSAENLGLQGPHKGSLATADTASTKTFARFCEAW